MYCGESSLNSIVHKFEKAKKFLNTDMPPFPSRFPPMMGLGIGHNFSDHLQAAFYHIK